MARTFADFRKLKEAHEGNGASDVTTPADLNYKILSDKIDPASIVDLNRWLFALSNFVSPYFPSKDIETRLNLYGYTAYLDADYLEGEDEAAGEELIPVYVYFSGVEVKNLVINIAWEKDGDGEYHIDAKAEVISDDEYAALVSSDDTEVTDNVDPEDVITKQS